MKVGFSNRSDRKLLLIIEPNPDHYTLQPGDTVLVSGGLECGAEGEVLVDWFGDDLVLYEDCSEGNEVIVSKNGERMIPWADSP